MKTKKSMKKALITIVATLFLLGTDLGAIQPDIKISHSNRASLGMLAYLFR